MFWQYLLLCCPWTQSSLPPEEEGGGGGGTKQNKTPANEAELLYSSSSLLLPSANSTRLSAAARFYERQWAGLDVDVKSTDKRHHSWPKGHLSTLWSYCFTTKAHNSHASKPRSVMCIAIAMTYIDGTCVTHPIPLSLTELRFEILYKINRAFIFQTKLFNYLFYFDLV